MRRGLEPSDLGDLFEQPLAAVMSIGLADGSVFSRPVWHRWIDGKFVFQFPFGDRKISMLGRDPRATVVLAENAYPYRAIEVRGRITMSPDGYHEISTAICQPAVDSSVNVTVASLFPLASHRFPTCEPLFADPL